jgi:hypothetical protein
MKRVKEVQIILVNKEGHEDLVDWSLVKNVYGLITNTLEDKGLVGKENGVSTYEMSIGCNMAGYAIQYHDDSLECNINSSFQDEYTEYELKEMIIQDIKEEYFEQIIPENIDSSDWNKKFDELSKHYKKCMNEIEKHDNDMTDLNKEG